MRRPVGTRAVRPPKAARPPAAPALLRDRLAIALALVTIICLGLVFFFAKGTQFLMPGPLTSAHGAIENCSACHTNSGSGKLSWVHGLIAGDPLADSEACLTCHKMPDTAFNAHGTSAEVLTQSTKRLTKVAARTRAPQWARAQSAAFPTDDVVARGLYCATCHQEHQGANFNLNKISNEQCHSCHVVKFDNFDRRHPEFENYPFKRRTRIIYDHGGHFGKHLPGTGEEGSVKPHSRYVLDLSRQPQRQARHGRGAVRADLHRLPSRSDHRQGAGQRSERHCLPDRSRPRPAYAEQEERLDRRMAGRVRSRAHAVHEDDDQPE